MKPVPRKRQRGQMIGVAAVVMVVIVGMLAFVVDAGRFLETRRELRNAADAGALAGVSQLPDDPDAAADLAEQFATATAATSVVRLCREAPTHDIDVGTFDLAGGGFVYAVTVTSECEVDYTFGRILNLLNTPVRGRAIAGLGSLREADCPIPLGVEDFNGDADGDGDYANDGFGYPFGEIVSLKVGDPSTGNFHIFDFGPGASGYRETLGGCTSGDVILSQDEDAPTETGNMPVPTKFGLLDRGLAECSGAGQPDLCTVNPDYVVACPDNLADIAIDGQLIPGATSVCLGVVPIVISWEDMTGKDYMNIPGFALFFITGQVIDGPDNYVEGAFIKGTVLGDIGAYDEYGVDVFRLIR